MGIPYYFNRILRDFQALEQVPHTYKTNYFLLDFNSIIHNCAREVVKEDINYDSIFNSIFQKLVDMLNIIDADTVYISIDGLCPMAKIQQQRKRRFMNASDTTNETVWDSNIVTPGTEFMESLDEALYKFINKNKDILQCEVILSPSSDAGEGEHKLFDFLREREPVGSNKSAVIYGLDADLIMLSLIQTHITDIRLMREKPAYNKHIVKRVKSEYVFLNIPILKSLVEKQYNISIECYVVICFLLGNDFIPSLSFLSIKHNGIEELISCYDASLHGPIVYENEINHLALMNIFNNLNKSSHESTILPESYYDLVFPKLVEYSDICNEYIKGIYWCFAYYFKRHSYSNMWYYPYNYSPKIQSLCIYGNSFNETQTTQMRNNIYELMEKNSDIQLLLVLPPKSLQYIRNTEIRSFATDINKGFVHCFPIKFRKESLLKQNEWQYIPLIPKIDLFKLYKDIRNCV